MHTRDRDIVYTWRINRESCIASCIFAMLIYGFVLGMAAAVVGNNITSHNSMVDARVQLAQMIDNEHGQARQIVANAVLKAYDKDKGSTLSPDAFSDPDSVGQFVNQISSAAINGTPIAVSDNHQDWHGWRVAFLEIGFSALGVVFILIWFVSYALETSEHGEFLADFPWRRGWPIAFVALTALPIGWVFYAVSAVRLYRFRKNRAAALAPQDADLDLNMDMPRPPHLEPMHLVQPRPKEVRFFPAPKAARAQYIELREHAWTASYDRRRAELKEEIAYQVEELRRFGQYISEAQRAKGTAQAELSRLNDAGPESAPARELIEAEFERMLKLPGVESVRVINGAISLLVKPRPVFGDVRYDFGDWEIRFGADKQWLQTKELRTGVRSGWHEGYPAYRLGEGSFCFGRRSDVIVGHVQKGQFLQAVEVAIDCMHSVNDEDRHNVSRAFEEAV